tara:strand:- start:5535 stop:6587 length:1053 start_codon:yes stop_codon:yes gene_type:complete
MDEGKRNLLAYQIISGEKFFTINKQRYKILSPSKELKLLAELIYQDTIESLRFDNFITREKAQRLLLGLGLWGPNEEIALKKLEKHLDDQKIRLYHALYDTKKQTGIRRTIKTIKTNIEKAYMNKYALDHMTLEYHAMVIKHKYITGMCLRDMNNDAVYDEDGFWNSNSTILERVVDMVNQSAFTITQIRELARNDPWRAIWNIGKENCLGIAASELTEDQKTLITFSKMYENAYQSMECPSDEVFEDDDMFDGWMIEQRRTREKEQKQKETNTLNNIPDKAQEVFIPAPSREDADKIYAMNTDTARRTIKERADTIERLGEVRAQDLPDTKLELRNQQREEYMAKMKGK